MASAHHISQVAATDTAAGDIGGAVASLLDPYGRVVARLEFSSPFLVPPECRQLSWGIAEAALPEFVP